MCPVQRAGGRRIRLHGAQGRSMRTTRSSGPRGAYRRGSDGPNTATIGVPTAAARCIGPVSPVIIRSQRSSTAATASRSDEVRHIDHGGRRKVALHAVHDAAVSRPAGENNCGASVLDQFSCNGSEPLRVPLLDFTAAGGMHRDDWPGPAGKKPLGIPSSPRRESGGWRSTPAGPRRAPRAPGAARCQRCVRRVGNRAPGRAARHRRRCDSQPSSGRLTARACRCCARPVRNSGQDRSAVCATLNAVRASDAAPAALVCRASQGASTSRTLLMPGMLLATSAFQLPTTRSISALGAAARASAIAGRVMSRSPIRSSRSNRTRAGFDGRRRFRNGPAIAATAPSTASPAETSARSRRS